MTPPLSPRRHRRLQRRRRKALATASAAILALDLVVVASAPRHEGPRRAATSGVEAAPSTTSGADPTTTSVAPAPSTPAPVAAVGPLGAAASRPPGGGTAAAGRAVSACQIASVCVTVDATRQVAPVNHAGAGFLAVPSGFTDSALLASLGTTMYRSAPAVTASGAYDWTEWDAAVAAGAHTTLDLSDLWSSHYPGGPPPTPWSNWTAYDEWVQTTVAQVLLSHRRVDFWQVYNEPGWRHYYSSADYATMTPDDLLQQFLHAYRDIRAVDPGAAITGPSVGRMNLTPGPPDDPLTRGPDIVTFLNFAAANDLQLAAVSWHDNSLVPQQVVADAQVVAGLIRSHPQLGSPVQFLDEYGSAAVQPAPGWDVGYLSAIAQGGFGYSVRSCWDGCFLATLNGLLNSSGQPLPDYFVRTTYAQMSGSTIESSTTDGNVPALASLSADGRHVVGLIGRMFGCDGAACPPPTTVGVQVVLPWSGPARVALSYEPDLGGATLAAPVPASPTNLVLAPDGAGRELLSFDIPAFAENSAYNLTISAG